MPESNDGQTTTRFEHEYHTVPREKKLEWGDGPWVDEPDKAQWRDAATGLPCLLVRNASGALCGYVGVYPTHPYHGKPEIYCHEEECIERMRVETDTQRAKLASLSEDEVRISTMLIQVNEMMLRRNHARCTAPPGEHITDYNVSVHGGITFSDFCQPAEDEGHGICHVERPDEPPVWWLGFDCAHGGDLLPAHEHTMRQLDKKLGENFAEKFGHLHLNDQYRDVAYVMRECTDLAAQLAAVEHE